MRLRPILACSFALVGLPLTAATVHASGNAVARFGGEHGTVNTTNPTALYYNPAAIGFSTGAQLFVDGQLAMRSLQWTHTPGRGDVIPPPNLLGSSFGTAHAFNVFGAPMLGATWRVGKFALGAAAYAPFGGSVSFARDPRFASRRYPGAQDGVARWHGIEGSTKAIYGTVGVAYRTGRLSLGVSVNVIYTTLELTRAQSVTGSNAVASEGRSRLKVSGLHGSFGAGATLEAVSDRLWLSVSYQAQPGLGVQALNGKLEVDASAYPSGDSLTRDVTFHQALPDIWRAGIRYRPTPRHELRLAADLTRWSVLQTQCVSLKGMRCVVDANGDPLPDSGVVQNVRRYWHDTLGVRLGGSWWLPSSIELFAGLGLESRASPDRTLEPMLVDGANVSLALGGRFEIAPSWFLAASYTHLQFFERDNSGKSRLADPTAGAVTRQMDGGGVYRQWVGVLDANVTKAF